MRKDARVESLMTVRIKTLPGSANDIPQEQEHQNGQTEVNVSHVPGKKKRMTHAEITCEKDEKKRLKETTL